MIGDEMTHDEIIREHMRKLGRKGGKRSLETMTPAARLRRSRKASKAAAKAHRKARSDRARSA